MLTIEKMNLSSLDKKEDLKSEVPRKEIFNHQWFLLTKTSSIPAVWLLTIVKINYLGQTIRKWYVRKLLLRLM